MKRTSISCIICFIVFFSHVGKFKIKPSFKAGLYVFNVHTKFCFDKMLIKFDNI